MGSTALRGKSRISPRRYNVSHTVASDAMALGRPAPWREAWHRLKTVASEDEAIEAIGDLRELLEEEDLLLPDVRKR